VSAAPEAAPAEGERIAKVLARAGVASRRDAELMIEEGRVALEGETVETPATLVTPDMAITVDGEPLREKERTRLFLYHKPPGLVTTAKDPEGRPTVFDALPGDLPRVVSVGRLDINTEGLLLLTNDGGLARVLAHPSTGWLRRYKVRAFGEITQDRLDALRGGIEIEGMHYGPIEARLEREQGSNVWIMMGLREGKNREVKRVLEHLGLSVNRLIRLSFGPFQLADLPEGAVEEVRTRILKDQLGPELAAEAGVDFEAPVLTGEAAPTPDHARRERPLRERPGADRPARAGERPPRRGAEDAREEKREAAKKERLAQTARRAKVSHVWRDEDIARSPASEQGLRRRGRKAAEPAPDAEAPERKTARAASVADRKGRRILVEKVVRAPVDEAPARRAPRAGAAGEEGLRRPTRREQGLPRREPGEGRANPRFAREPGEGRANPRFAREPGEGRPGDERPRRPRAEDGARPERPLRPRAPRPEGDERPARPFRPRPARGEGRPGDDRPRGPRPERADRPRGPRAASGDERPRSPRPEGLGRSGAPRSGPRPGGKPGEGRPGGPRPGGSRPGGPRPGGRPGGGKPGGRPPRGGDRG
jgi:23S rRNA pseudouridine2605 synthase